MTKTLTSVFKAENTTAKSNRDKQGNQAAELL